MSLMWEYPPNAALYVYGDGRLRLQVYPVVSDDPDDPFVMRNRSGFVPTCEAKINIDEIKSLVDLMIERHFFDLPEKGYVYSTVARKRRKLELYTIAVDNGSQKANRTLGIGEYQGRNESQPTDFAAIEEALVKMRDSAFHIIVRAGLPLESVSANRRLHTRSPVPPEESSHPQPDLHRVDAGIRCRQSCVRNV